MCTEMAKANVERVNAVKASVAKANAVKTRRARVSVVKASVAKVNAVKVNAVKTREKGIARTQEMPRMLALPKMPATARKVEVYPTTECQMYLPVATPCRPRS